MGWYGGGMTGFAWMGMGLFWLVLIGLIVWLVLRLLPGKAQAAPSEPTTAPATSGVDPALAILDQRLAAGEIDVETYRAIRATLLEGRGAAR